MRSSLALVLVLACASVATADQVTADSVLAAHKTGARASSIIALINDPANIVVSPSAADLSRLEQANVPVEVVQALLTRVQSGTPHAAAQASLPDDQRLIGIVNLVRQGLSESLVAEQIARSGEMYQVSVNDLIYLKHNQVAESVISALMATSAGRSSTAPSGAQMTTAPSPMMAAAASVEVDNLVFMQPTFVKKNRDGKLLFKGDEISWLDASNPTKNFSLRASGIKKAEVRCQPRADKPFCYELSFKIFKGETYKFQDAQISIGINDQIERLREVFRQLYPSVVIKQKID